MTKQEAADELGVSVRALERYTQQSRIAARYEKGRTRPTIVYDEAEVERFKSDLEQVKHRPALERPGANSGSGSGISHTFEAGKALNFANDANSLASSGEILSLEPNSPALALLFGRGARPRAFRFGRAKW